MARNPNKCPHCGRQISLQDRGEVKKDRPNAFAMWTVADDRKLHEMYTTGATNFELCEALERQPGAIMRRIEKLQLWRSSEAAAKASPRAFAAPETAEESAARAETEEMTRLGLSPA